MGPTGGQWRPLVQEVTDRVGSGGTFRRPKRSTKSQGINRLREIVGTRRGNVPS